MQHFHFLSKHFSVIPPISIVKNNMLYFSIDILNDYSINLKKSNMNYFYSPHSVIYCKKELFCQVIYEKNTAGGDYLVYTQEIP